MHLKYLCNHNGLQFDCDRTAMIGVMWYALISHLQVRVIIERKAIEVVTKQLIWWVFYWAMPRSMFKVYIFKYTCSFVSFLVLSLCFSLHNIIVQLCVSVGEFVFAIFCQKLEKYANT